MYVDNAAMQLVRNPGQFDVIVTGNCSATFCPIRRACASAPSACWPRAARCEGKGLYEPIHGSAPDIAGQGKANPLATILSAAMMLRYSLGMAEAADRIEAAVAKALEGGARSFDLGGTMTTREMGDAVLAAL
jgi:3-isopropylmalate dehydrogenase